MVVFITISYGRHETLILQLFAEVPTCRQMTMDSLGLSYDGRAAFLANLAIDEDATDKPDDNARRNDSAADELVSPRVAWDAGSCLRNSEIVRSNPSIRSLSPLLAVVYKIAGDSEASFGC